MMATDGNSLPSQSCPDGPKRRVCYYYDSGIAGVDYGEDHVMVPRRVDMAHALISSYGLLDDMAILCTRPATAGLWDYCQRYAGGSLAAARALAGGEFDIAINWSGGMHHACQGGASGFCYVNDIVLAINELLRRFRRVLYVDIDVHHGDGVETAFVDSNRVMTVSFHQDTKDFFPEGRGSVSDVGEGEGRYRALNVPLNRGMDDDGYFGLFRRIMTEAMAVFQPEAIVMQCGGDSLSGDRLGGQNLSVAGHARCVGFMRSHNTPLLLLGGGGYTVNHVASCWCYETAVAIGKEINDDIPMHCYDRYYFESQGYKLHYPVNKKMKNENTDGSIEKTAKKVLRILSLLEAAPSVQFEDPAAGGGSIDAEALFHRTPPAEDGDPMVRLFRLCGEQDVRGFIMELGSDSGKRRQLEAAQEDEEENGCHQTHRDRSEKVKSAGPERCMSNIGENCWSPSSRP